MIKDITLCIIFGVSVKSLQVVPCYIITSYLAGDYFQVLHNIIVPAVPWVRQAQKQNKKVLREYIS